MASFRRSEAGPTGVGRFGGAGPVAGSPFSQSQILHLMKTEFARARRYGFPVSCMLVQVDRLDALVDLHGGALRDYFQPVEEDSEWSFRLMQIAVVSRKS